MAGRPVAVLGLATTISSTDGIGVYTAGALAALARTIPDAVVHAHTLDMEAGAVQDSAVTVVHSPSRARYLLAAASDAWRRPDEIFVFHVSLMPLAVVLGWLTGARTTLFVYGIEIIDNRRRRDRWAAGRAHRIVAISRYTASQTERFLPRRRRDRREPIALVAPPVDTTRFPRPSDAQRQEARARFALAPEAVVLLTVGRLSEFEQYKGHDRVIRVLPALRRRFPTVQYLIAGRGNDQARLEALTHEHAVDDCVRFLGFQPDLLPCYHAADVFVMPSTHEGFGIVFVEAMAAGRPVVGGALDGSADATVFGSGAFLCNPYDDDSIETVITSCVQAVRAGTDPRVDSARLSAMAGAMFGAAAFHRQLAVAIGCDVRG